MKRLKFKKSSMCKGYIFDSEDVAELPSGSKIYRKELKIGRVFQLFLNKDEYNRLKKDHGNNYRIHFYGGNYVYLNEYQKLTPLLNSIFQ